MGLSLKARHLCVEWGADSSQKLPATKLFGIEELVLESGQSMALYGPSGSGKTTLLNNLAGLDESAHASLIWSDGAGRTCDIGALSARERERWRLVNMGLVFQQFQLFPAMSALENVLTPYRFDHWICPEAARTRARDLLQQFGVAASAQTATLSRGEQQRVAIARALVREPSAVVADEPTASLDSATSKVVMDLLFANCERLRATLIVATHDRALAARFDRVMEFRDGELVESTA
jgi:putative ABC transport system ATP-binding protein